MKKTMTLLTALLASASVYSEGYGYLTLACGDGSEQTLTAVGLEITFSDGQLLASNATTGETATLVLADLAKMYFTPSKSGDEVKVVDASTTAWGLDEAEALYDLAGRAVQRSALRPGVYVMKKGSETKKIHVK